jgi:prolipoprotein diacylglyceryl transferase
VQRRVTVQPLADRLTASVVAYLPSPSSGALHVGKFQLRAYGLMIALGVVAAVSLTGRRLEKAGYGKRDDIAGMALWAVPAGVIGARLYHVITDWKSFEGRWFDVVKVWQGGLGIWGGIGLGVPVGLWAARKRGLQTADALWAAAPALPLAQAIGRWGNWFNQELFGRPTTLPWGLKIDPVNRPDQYRDVVAFHPTFLYESLWNFALCGVLLWIDRRFRPKAGRLFAMYVAGYTFMRFFIERLRVDKASLVAGLRVNEWVSGALFLIAALYLVRTRGQQRPERAPEPESVAGDPGAGDEVDADADGDDGVAVEPEAAPGVEPDVEPEVEPDEAVGAEADDASADDR